MNQRIHRIFYITILTAGKEITMRFAVILFLLAGALQAEEIKRPAWNWYGGWKIKTESASIVHTPKT